MQIVDRKGLDAIGLARLVGFQDFPDVVSAMREAKMLPRGLVWLPNTERQFIAICKAKKN